MNTVKDKNTREQQTLDEQNTGTGDWIDCWIKRNYYVTLPTILRSCRARVRLRLRLELDASQ